MDLDALRHDSGAAARILREQLPDPNQREQFETLLVDAIDRANEQGQAAWSITLNRLLVRLNVGNLRIVDVHRGRVGFWALGSDFDANIKERISAHPASRGKLRRVDDAVGYRGPIDVFFDLLPDVRRGILGLIDIGCSQASLSAFRRSHSPAVLEYLRTSTGREVPEPDYPTHLRAPRERDQGASFEAFSWRPAHEAIAAALLDHREDRQQLVEVLQELSREGYPVVRLIDRIAPDEEGPLRDVDPFTVFSCFTRSIREERRVAMLVKIAERLGVTVEPPRDFHGLPTIQNQATWFFWNQMGRDEGDIDRLWELFEQIVEGGKEAVDPELFDRILEQKGIGAAKLTMGLFWVKPDEFLPVDSNTCSFVEPLGVHTNVTSWESYTRFLADVDATLGRDHTMLSHTAWTDGKGDPEMRRYWAGDVGDAAEGGRVKEFVERGFWEAPRLGPEDSAESLRTRARLRQIRAGDRFALKSCADRVVIHARGEVKKVDLESARVDFVVDDREARHHPDSEARGAGNWQARFLEVTDEKAIARYFGVLNDTEVTSGTPVPPDADPISTSRFEQFCRQLATTGLVFPTELVASYLLALQTKRFTILTGISGTGKTQLAIACAKFFGSSTDGKRAAAQAQMDDAHVRKVVQTVFDYRFFNFTKSFIEAEPEFMEAAGESKTVALHFMGSRTPWRAQFRSYGEKHSTPPRLYIPKEHMTELEKQLDVGDEIRFDVREPSDGAFSLHLEKVGGPWQPALATGRYSVIAVRPDWTDHRALLGHRDPFDDRYHVSQFLELLLDASDEHQRATRRGEEAAPFFAILDEMNLARVEHYFSDFLSCLESGEKLVLHGAASLPDATGDREVPGELDVPPNLFFTGTINVDETTYMFSPKVLDRAFTFEFNAVDLMRLGRDAEDDPTPLALAQLSEPLALSKPDRHGDAWRALEPMGWRNARDALVRLNERLHREHRHFGYRVANEIARFLGLAHEQADSGPATMLAALDVAVLTKVLPKLHGTQVELDEVLRDLFAFAVDFNAPDGVANELDSWHFDGDWLVRAQQPAAGSETPDTDTATTDPAPPGSTTAPLLPRSASKLWRMRRRLAQLGFTSFVE